jgi:hypothetical protein
MLLDVRPADQRPTLERSASRTHRLRINGAQPLPWALAATCLALAGSLLWSPRTPDLAAQVARANLARHVGAATWWTGWFGGVSLPTYSVYVPLLMAALGVALTGAAGVLLGTWAASRLAEGCVRPRTAAVAAGLAQVADLLAGRVTFAVGMGLVLAALAMLRARRPTWAAGLLLAGFLASPLAGLFGGIALLTVVATVAGLRRIAGWLALALLAAAASMELLFPGTGTMPIGWSSMWTPAACCMVIAVTCSNRTARVGAALTLLSITLLMVEPGAVGGNIARLVWVFGVPILLGCARRPRWQVATAAFLLACWPVSDLVQQLEKGHDPSSTSAFYAPMLEHLADAQTALGPNVTGERLEIVTPASQWSVVYADARTPLARGWERQTDVADNPLFYRAGALTPASYRQWLDDLAVGWVALPHVALDGAARGEAALVAAGLPYLIPTWTSTSWTLYRVDAATPLATGARIVSVEPTAIVIHADRSTTVFLRVRWTPYFIVTAVDRAKAHDPTVSKSGRWTSVTVSAAGTYRITTRFDPFPRLHP